MQTILLFSILFGSGVVLVCLGLSGFLGYRRKSYILWYEYGYVSGGINYGSIPLGITCIMWAFIFTLPIQEKTASAFLFISLGIGFVGILFGIFQPKFLMPQWYRWLRTNHKDIMPLLRKDVTRIGYDVWQERTRTQAGLEAWVAEVRQKHNL